AFSIESDRTGQRLRIQVRPPAASEVEALDVTSEPVLDGSWHHIVWVDDGEAARLYVDRQTSDEAQTHETIANRVTRRILGAGFPVGARVPCCYFNGAIDELRVYDHALTSREVLGLFEEACAVPDQFAITPRALSEEGGELRVQVSPSSLLTQGYFLMIGDERIEEFDSEGGQFFVEVGPREPGSYPVSLHCPTGASVAFVDRGLTITGPDPCDAPVELDRIEPPVALRNDAVRLEIHGSGFFDETLLVSVGDQFLEGIELISSNLMVGTYVKPPLGVLDVAIYCGDEVVAQLGKAVEFIDPIQVIGVSPERTSVDGGEEVVVSGWNFRADTKVLIGGAPVRNLELAAVPGAADTLTGNAPPGLAPGVVDLVVTDPRGDVTLEEAIEYVMPEGEPAPTQIEANYAEGVLRIEWQPPRGRRLRRVDILDPSGRVVATAEEDKTRVEIQTELDSPGLYCLVGESLMGVPTRPGFVFVQRKDCDTPPPLSAIQHQLKGRFQNLTYESAEFSLYGNHPPAEVDRCVDPDPQIAFFGAAPPRKGKMPKGVGSIRPLKVEGDSEVTTGFVLERAASRLEIALHCRKLEVDFGVQLRCRISKVGPDRGFTDEFTFPDTLTSDTNDWLVMTYFRAESDVGLELEDGTGPQACNSGDGDCGTLMIPEGEYTATFYTVGGDPKIPYYSVSADPSPEELLIPDTPCPPYPLVRVRDVSQETVLPFVQEVLTLEDDEQCPGLGFARRISVAGYTLDECNNTVPLTALDPRFEYRYTIYDSHVPTVTSWSWRSSIEECLGCGCYRVDVDVRVVGCPVTRTYRHEIVVEPDEYLCQPPRPFEFLYPQPAPAGVSGVIGLNTTPPPGRRVYADTRPLEFSVLVSPNCDCDDNTNCPSAEVDDIEFDLVARSGQSLVALNTGFVVVDSLCSETTAGPKYFEITLDDLGAVERARHHDEADKPMEVYFAARAKGTNAPWQTIGGALQIFNPPDVLYSSSWRANFSDPNCYFFSVQSSQQPAQDFNLGASLPINIEIPDIGGGRPEPINVDGHEDNDLSSGFTSKFSLDNGVWSSEDGVGGLRGGMMGNEISGDPLQVSAETIQNGQFGLGNSLDWEWCSGGNLFNHEFETDIFKGILFAGTIWVIPVTISASIGFGYFFNIDYQTTFQLHPFSSVQPFQPGCPDNIPEEGWSS
ncbi:MAG: LamG-like jellyroll fold domain-containing protein, partial [Planctomycetota bacterium]